MFESIISGIITGVIMFFLVEAIKFARRVIQGGQRRLATQR